MLPWDVVYDGALVLVVTCHLVTVQLAKAARIQVVVVVIAHLQPALVFAHNAVLEATPLVPGVEVHLADAGRVVPTLIQYLGPRLYAGFAPVSA